MLYLHDGKGKFPRYCFSLYAVDCFMEISQMCHVIFAIIRKFQTHLLLLDRFYNATSYFFLKSVCS